jgi:hypothetical protein
MTPFLVKVKYVKQQDNGNYGYVKEEYLIYGYSFTDVESVIYEQLGMLIKGEFIIISINRYNIQDCLLKENSDWFYLVKIKYTPIDDDNGRKQITNRIIVEAKSIENATEIIVQHFDSIGLDYEKVEFKKTGIIEVFYSKIEIEENEEKEK